jgi:biopolymer transport protein ExbD
MRRKRRAEIAEEPNVNLTPLIDVVFVILFTFIVVAPLLDVDHIDLAPGISKEGTKSPDQMSPVAIHVYSDDSITYNQQYVSLEELADYLALDKQRHPKVVPQIFHDKKATFGTYQAIKNAVEMAGFPQMDLILKPS